MHNNFWYQILKFTRLLLGIKSLAIKKAMGDIAFGRIASSHYAN